MKMVDFLGCDSKKHRELTLIGVTHHERLLHILPAEYEKT